MFPTVFIQKGVFPSIRCHTHFQFVHKMWKCRKFRKQIEMSQKIFCSLGWDKIICVEWWEDCNCSLNQYMTVAEIAYFHSDFYIVFHLLRFAWHSFSYVILLHPLLLQWHNLDRLENWHHPLLILMNSPLIIALPSIDVTVYWHTVYSPLKPNKWEVKPQNKIFSLC